MESTQESQDMWVQLVNILAVVAEQDTTGTKAKLYYQMVIVALEQAATAEEETQYTLPARLALLAFARSVGITPLSQDVATLAAKE